MNEPEEICEIKCFMQNVLKHAELIRGCVYHLKVFLLLLLLLFDRQADRQTDRQMDRLCIDFSQWNHSTAVKNSFLFKKHEKCGRCCRATLYTLYIKCFKETHINSFMWMICVCVCVCVCLYICIYIYIYIYIYICVCVCVCVCVCISSVLC